jgi:hypothetical protein
MAVYTSYTHTHTPMSHSHPNVRAKSSAFRCVYLQSIRGSLCPVILATSMMFSPFSNIRVVAS